MTATATAAPVGITRLGQVGAAIGVLGLAGLAFGIAGAHGDREIIKNVLQSYLYGWVMAMLVALGCFGLMLLQYMTRGSWARPVIRLFEAGAKTLPLMFVLYLPMLIWSRYIYPWANPALVYGDAAHGIKADATLLHRAGYMNVTTVLIRTVIYFVIWSMFTFILAQNAKRQDETGDLKLAMFRQKMSSYGFVIYVVTITLAFTDWIMSLDTHWFSTIYGLWFMIFQGLAAMAFIGLFISRQKLAHKEPYATLVTPQVTRDIGNMLLTLTMFWAYFSVSQWIIIWSGNLPEEITFYLRRNQGTFLAVGALNIIFSFFAPFLLLLSSRNKRTAGRLGLICFMVIVMRFVDIFWIVVPVTRHPIQLIPTDVAGAAFAIGAFLAAFGYYATQSPILPQPEEPLVLEAAHG